MKMLQRHSATMFRFVLDGELTRDRVREFEQAWTAARSILGTKALVVEISGITNADAGRRRVALSHAGNRGRLNAALPPESAEFIRSMGNPGDSARSVFQHLDSDSLARLETLFKIDARGFEIPSPHEVKTAPTSHRTKLSASA